MTVKENLTSKDILVVLNKHKDILLRYKVRRIGLFGSYARGEQKKRSDIDFLVEFEEPTFDNFMELASYLEKLFGKKVELITRSGLSPHLRPYIEKEVRWA
jgi:hypothetical protein